MKRLSYLTLAAGLGALVGAVGYVRKRARGGSHLAPVFSIDGYERQGEPEKYFNNPGAGYLGAPQAVEESKHLIAKAGDIHLYDWAATRPPGYGLDWPVS